MPLRLVTAYVPSDTLYHVAAIYGPGEGSTTSWNEELHGTSPDSMDQRIFLSIFRTLQEDSRVARRGKLFMGGHQLVPPYVLTSVDGRLVANGYMLPDVEPPSTRPPVPNAELETRRAIEASLRALRDSLRASGAEWLRVKSQLRSRALANPLVKSVVEDTGHSIQVVWGSGYQYLEIPESTRAFSYGGKGAFEQNEKLIVDRLEYLQALLEEGQTLFLLGGGSEFAVERSRGEATFDGARRLLDGKPLRSDQSGLLPADVRAQLLSPLQLERVR